eukprot:CAMPEP_0174754930 /NCGR_PEP_ID=MMETSP1094-20130205/105989_1 /TAXON_ID=156173 /ORGANISM="Chrysochromulina brevifilum, Strain UTEX LB 985" /LENGTH=64 /DNA_ID=CAMNT_0015960813 /DNA_START=971 /DNA_END=1165 /DNA_ORIENTATION=+
MRHSSEAASLASATSLGAWLASAIALQAAQGGDSSRRPTRPTRRQARINLWSAAAVERDQGFLQ